MALPTLAGEPHLFRLDASLRTNQAGFVAAAIRDFQKQYMTRYFLRFLVGIVCPLWVGLVITIMLQTQLAWAAGYTAKRDMRADAPATYEVNVITDGVDANIADGVCDINLSLAGQQCTLRAALQQANQHSGRDTVLLTSGLTYTLSLTGTPEDAGASGDLDILDDMLLQVLPSVGITGTGSATKTREFADGLAVIDAQQRSRVLQVVQGHVEISGVAFYNGSVSDVGGGVLNQDNVLMTNSVVLSNSASSGGGIYNAGGELSLKDVVIVANRATGLGGGVYNDPLSRMEMSGGKIISNSLESNEAYGAGLANANIAGLYQVVVSGNWISSTETAIGGGMVNYNSGTLSLELCQVQGNWITVTLPGSGNGGGLHNADNSHFILISSTIVGNQAAYGGGLQNDGLMTITASSIYSNVALLVGGGLANIGGDSPLAQLTLMNTTVSGNTSLGHAGGIRNDGVMALHNVTVVQNTADSDRNGTGDGGGIVTGSRPTVTVLSYMVNSVVALNVDASPTVTNQLVAPDCSGVLIAQGYGLLQSLVGCKLTGTVSTVLSGIDPLLSALSDQGGATWSAKPLFGSPLINQGAPDGCMDPSGTVFVTDQRGLVRPLDGQCDLGAVETKDLVTSRLYLPVLHQ